MPTAQVEFTVTLKVKAKVDPDQLPGFDGNSAEPADVEQYLKDNVLISFDDLMGFGTDVDPDAEIVTSTVDKIEITPEESDEDE